MPAPQPADDTVNGISIAELANVKTELQEKPYLASCVFRVRNGWIDGGHNRTRIQDFYAVGKENSHSRPLMYDADEPVMLLGQDQAASPAEFALHALAACLTTSLVFAAAVRGIPLEEVASTVEGDLDSRGVLELDDRVRNGFQQVRVTFHIKADAPDDVLEELCRAAQETSPVFDIMTNGVPVDVRCQRA
jgi:uncharacterized OsmC-like protein